jgi:uracil-DNA glycosylase
VVRASLAGVMTPEFDKGPPARFATLFAAMPSYAAFADHFWIDWGPVFYRGRLDGSQRLICIASDPGPTERIAGRTLVGDAGQRVQGFIEKLGLTRSYLCLNAYAVALIPSHADDAEPVLSDPAHLAWRNRVYDKAKSASVEAVVAFGEQAQRAAALWRGKGELPLINIPHPSSHDEAQLLTKWRAAITQLRALITPDSDGDDSGPNYAATFRESDYRPIPRRDLPFGAPAFLGDDAWLRALQPPRRSSVSRPSPDDRHTLTWIAPRS